MMSKEAMKLALEALKELVAQTETGFFAVRHDHVAMQDARQAITALREALAAPVQQEPVAMVCHDLDGHIGWNPNLRQLPDEGTALYTSPPAQRTWVDLTDDEIKKEFHPLHATGLQFARAVLAKSKEKNT
jgi:hypothetical protein